jgi:hypothetical protein
VKKEGHLVILKRLVARGLLKNNREMGVIFCRRSLPLIFRVIRSMTHLEKLSLSECNHKGMTLTEDVPQLFRSCPTLNELHLRIVKSQVLEMNEELKNELRSGFLRLRLLELDWEIDSWLKIQEMLS